MLLFFLFSSFVTVVLDSIIRHKPVYCWYMHRLNFVYNPSLTSKLPLFNFMFQLADESNFILYLQPLWPVLSQNIFLLISLFFSPFPFLTTLLAPAGFKDNQGVKRKLWWRSATVGVSAGYCFFSCNMSCIISAVVDKDTVYSTVYIDMKQVDSSEAAGEAILLLSWVEKIPRISTPD